MKSIIALTLMGVLSMSATPAKAGDEEQPKYKVVLSEEDFEIRDYEAYYVVSTVYDTEKGESTGDGFRKLFKYISGENKTEQKIEMTAPVTTSEDTSQKIEMTAPVTISENAGKRKMTFMVPSRFYNTSIPEPTNPDVKIEKIEAQTRAVIKFSWYAGDSKKEDKSKLLLKWIESKGYTPLEKPFYAGYNSPYALPWLRTNEMIVRVNKR